VRPQRCSLVPGLGACESCYMPTLGRNMPDGGGVLLRLDGARPVRTGTQYGLDLRDLTSRILGFANRCLARLSLRE
jgi:hypothetical protein